ncbi:MAG: fumarylacetoacetate hydrolase family protein [Akkermansiaceae bacterium]
MKLTRYYSDDRIIPGIFLDDQNLLNVSAFGEDWNETFFETSGLSRLSAWLEKNGKDLPVEDAANLRLAPAIARPSKIVCIGLNYIDHAEESGMEPPEEPVVFFKSTSAWCGPNDNLVIPKRSQKTDWEVELAVVIGKKAKYVSQDEALDYVAGYALHNDYSERAWQLEGTGQWVKGKSADTYAPFGPYMTTCDEIPDPGALKLWLSVNGKEMQNGHTSNLIFNVPHIVSYLSQYMTLLPGDVISTGTPAGVGLGFDPPIYLKSGDVVRLGIDGLGEQQQNVVADN